MDLWATRATRFPFRSGDRIAFDEKDRAALEAFADRMAVLERQDASDAAARDGISERAGDARDARRPILPDEARLAAAALARRAMLASERFARARREIDQRVTGDLCIG